MKSLNVFTKLYEKHKTIVINTTDLILCTNIKKYKDAIISL